MINQSRIYFRKGTKLNLPRTAPCGEPLFCIDTKELFVGMGKSVPPVKINISLDDLFENPEDIEYLKKLASLFEIIGEDGATLQEFMDSMNTFKTLMEGFKTDMESFKTTVTNFNNTVSAYMNTNNTFQGTVNSYIQANNTFQETVNTFMEDITPFKQTVQTFMNSKGKPNGLAPLDSEGKVPEEHLPKPKIQTDILYESRTTTPEQQTFILSNINFTKYKKIEIRYTQPHNCANNFYVNGDYVFCPAGATREVYIVLENSEVRWTNGSQTGSRNFIPKTNGELKWIYTSSCTSPQFNYISVIGYY